MADEKLGEDAQQKAKAWLEKHWLEPRTCPTCRQNAWVVGDRLVSFPALKYEEGKDMWEASEGVVYPHVLTICTVCGHTLFFNAVAVGIWQAWKAQEQEAAQDAK